MIRVLRRTGPPAPLAWELYVAIGGGLIGAAVVFAAIYPDWGADPWLAFFELSVFVGVGGVLLALGRRRRRRSRSD